jgi:glycosyltransferase involved in cell wall biosynthesis
MKILHLSSNDISGGAARAAYRLHQAYLQHEISSRMQVGNKKSDLHTIDGAENRWQKAINLARPQLAKQLMGLQNSPNPIIHSPAFLPSGLVQKLNSAEADVLHLHWVGSEFLSVEDIGKLKKPLVWTLHDMWPFSGAEHYGDDSSNARWRVGYYADNRPDGHRGIDLDRWVWNRKRRAWKQPIKIVAPSQWLADCAKKSILMQNWAVSIIPHALDVNTFCSWNQAMARKLLGVPQDKKLVLFGAIGGGKDSRKGWDLLQPALTKLAKQMPNLAGVVFGQSEPLDPPQLGLPLYWMGHLYDEITIALLYNAADVMVVPSRQEAFGQTASEAQSSGCPVVAFHATGLLSVVVHEETGYLATPFDSDDLAQGIAWVLADSERYNKLSEKARDRAVRLWSPEVVVKQYVEVYESAIESHRQNHR